MAPSGIGDSDDKKRRTPFDEIFEGINKMMEEFSQKLPFILGRNDPEDPRDRPKPFVWGIKMNFGVDGQPEFEQFGNMTENRKGDGQMPEERSPLVDVLEETDDIHVIAELPGVSKKDIELGATETSVTIEAQSLDHRYRKEIQLPGKVKPETAKAKLKNGLLEIIIARKKDSLSFSV
ncbi:MAG: archaeal heat shock protein Hsp20 [Candidatus Hodarchaeales archaeon]|jgi:HSP20 family protein